MFNRKEYMKQYRIDNKEKLLEHSKQYNMENRDKHRKYSKEYYIKNQIKSLDYAKRYRSENKDKRNEYYIKNKEKMAKRQKIRRKENPEILRKWQNNKCKIDIKYNLSRKMGNALWKSLRGNKNNKHWESFFDYTINDLIDKLKKTMPKGYCWQDYMEGKLHIDHIVPISAFNYTKPEHTDFKRCWALENLRLLPARENRSKGSNLTKPFQPALQL